MNTARKGRAYEWRVRKKLEAKGYLVVRMAASKGPWDLIAAGHEAPLALLQCKGGRLSCFAAERLARSLYVPVGCRGAVIHECRKGCKMHPVTTNPWDCVHEAPTSASGADPGTPPRTNR